MGKVLEFHQSNLFFQNTCARETAIWTRKWEKSLNKHNETSNLCWKKDLLRGIFHLAWRFQNQQLHGIPKKSASNQLQKQEDQKYFLKETNYFVWSKSQQERFLLWCNWKKSWNKDLTLKWRLTQLQRCWNRKVWDRQKKKTSSFSKKYQNKAWIRENSSRLDFKWLGESYFFRWNKNKSIQFRWTHLVLVKRPIYFERSVSSTNSQTWRRKSLGCMTSKGIGYASKIDTTMDQHLYRSILEDELMQTIDFYGLDSTKVIFQHDNDPKHTAWSVKEWLGNQEFQTMTWPAQSPDLNPIEHLWSHVKRKLNQFKSPAKGINELWERIQQVWNEIDKETCLNLIRSMPSRIEAVLKAKGKWTKY